MNKVLIAEDDANILISLDYLMRKKGYEVFVAQNGEEALQLAIKHQPDVILLDIMMPKMDGYQVCQAIKSTKETSHAKIVFLSAKSKEEDIQKGMAAGANAYITKPFSTMEIVQKVKELIQE
jgi:two-component system alkaline phosphatase synthesis response regulator PhoP